MRGGRFLRMLSLAGVVSIFGAACTGGSTQPSSLQLGLGSTSLTLEPGGSAGITVRVARVGFGGDVTVTVQGLPSGVRAAPADVPAGQDTATLTLVADSTASAGSAQVTVQAAGAGGATATAPLTLVIGRAATSAFSFTVGSDSVRVMPAVPDTLDLTITRASGFTAPVVFAAAGLPSGMTASFRPDTITGDTGSLLLTAGQSVQEDTAFALTLTGSAAGVGVVSRALYVTATTMAPNGFLLQPASDSLVMYPGETDSVDMNIVRTGTFTAAVSVWGSAPAGLGVTVSPARVTGDSALVVVSASGSLTPDSTYRFELNGVGSSVPSVTDTVAVTIQAQSLSRIGPSLRVPGSPPLAARSARGTPPATGLPGIGGALDAERYVEASRRHLPVPR